MEHSYEQQDQGKEVQVLSTSADLGGSMPMPVTADVLTLGNNFLQRQLKDLLHPENKPCMAPPHEPAAGQAVRQSSPSLLASLWPMKASRDASAEPEAGCPPAEHLGNGTADGFSSGDAADCEGTVAAAAAALAETSPATLGVLIKTETSDDALPNSAVGREPHTLGGDSVGEPADEDPRAPRPPCGAAEEPQLNICSTIKNPEDSQTTEQEQEGIAALEDILARISGLDAEGWFQAPVREVDAPNYFKIIKKPMCFQVMRLKIKERVYVNWNEVVRDFELICSNAMKYNQRRSRIHKLALVMLRAGKKLLVEVEPVGRRAILLLQSGRGAVGGGGALAAQQSCAMPALPAHPQDSQAVPSSLMRSGVGTPGVSTAMLHMSRSLSTMDTATTSEILGARRGSDALDLASWQHPTEAGEEWRGYSSYSDTDMEEEEEGGETRGGLGGGASASPHDTPQQQLRGGQEGATPAMVVAQLEARWRRSKAAVLALPLCGDAAGVPAAILKEGRCGGQGGRDGGAALRAVAKEKGGGAAAHAAVPSSPSDDGEWSRSRRSVEWRIRWLELRMRELRHQRHLLTAQLAQRAQRGGAKLTAHSAPPSQPQGEGAAGLAADPAAAATAVVSGTAEGEAAVAAAGQEGGPPLHKPRMRRPLSDLQLPALLQHPFFGEHSTVVKREQRGRQLPAAAAEAMIEGSGLPAVPSALPEAVPGGGQCDSGDAEPVRLQLDDPDYPARAFVTLELLEKRLGALRQELLPYQRADPAMLAGGGLAVAGRGVPLHARTPSGGALVRSRSRATSGSGGAATPRSRSGLGPASKHLMPFRDGELRLGKRRRSEYDITDIVTPGVLGAPKFVERAQVKTIDTPKVRLLPDAEMKKREAAVSAFAAKLHESVAEPQAAAVLLEACSDSDAGSSSEEDTSDEAYLARHQPLQVEERVRYDSFASGGGQAQRNKKPTKVSKDRLRLAKPSRSASLMHQTPPAPPTLGPGSTPRSAAGSAAATPFSAQMPGPAPSSAQASAGARLPTSPAPPPSASHTPASTPSKAPKLHHPGAGVVPASSPLAGAGAGAGRPSTSLPQLFMVPMHQAMAAAHMHAVAAAAAAAAGQPPASLPNPKGEAGEGGSADGAAGTAPSPTPPKTEPPTAASAAGVPPLGPATTAAPKDASRPAGASGEQPVAERVPANGRVHPHEADVPERGGDETMQGDGSGGEAAAEGKGRSRGFGSNSGPSDAVVGDDHDSLPPALRAIIPSRPAETPTHKRQLQQCAAIKEGGGEGKPMHRSRPKSRDEAKPKQGGAALL